MEVQNDFSLEEIKEKQRSETDYKIKFRLLIIIHTLMGKSGPQIAEMLNIGKDQVYYWVQRYNQKGYKGLFDKKRSGRPRKINYENLREVLSDEPTANGLDADYWTVDVIYKYLTEYQDIKISKNYIYELLRSEKIQLPDKDVAAVDVSLYKTRSGHRITPLHLEVLEKAKNLIDAPIHKIITEDGIKPQLKITYSDKHETILQGETETGKLTIRYEESVG